MSNLNSNFKEILENLEKNIKDKEDLEFVKVQIFNLYNLFFEEITNLEELANNRVAEIARTQNSIEDKVEEIAKGIKNIEQDIYEDEEDDENDDYDYELTILCPYCDKEFTIDVDEVNEEVVCPECNHTIELDWENDCDDDCGCGCDDDDCGCGCNGCGHNDEEDM